MSLLACTQPHAGPVVGSPPSGAHVGIEGQPDAVHGGFNESGTPIYYSVHAAPTDQVAAFDEKDLHGREEEKDQRW
jgi:hypothetical protein